MIKIFSMIVMLLIYSCSTQSKQQAQMDELDSNSQSENIENENNTDESNDQTNDGGDGSEQEDGDEEYDSENEIASNSDDESENNTGSDSDNEYSENATEEESLEPNEEASGLDNYEEDEDSDNNYESEGFDTESEDLNSNSSSEVYNPTFNAESTNNAGESINSVNEEVSQNTEENLLADQSSDDTERNIESSESETSSEEATDIYDEDGSDSVESYDVLPVFDQLVWLGYYIDYQRREVKVKILTKGNPAFEIFQEQNRSTQPELVIRFFETNLRNKIKWDINASEFHSPVAYIRPRLDEYNGVVDVVLTVRDNVKPKFMSENSNITLTFPIPERYNGEAIVSEGEEATEEGDAVSLVGVNLTPEFEENTELPSSLSYLAEGDSSADGEASEASDASPGVGIEEVMSPEQSYDEEGLPANFDEGEQDDEEVQEDDNLLMYLQPIREFSILTVAQDNIYESNSNNAASEEFTNNGSDDGFSELARGENDSNLNSAEEAYDTYEATAQASEAAQTQDVEPGFEADPSYAGNVLSLEFVDSELGLVLQTLQEETGNNFIIPSDLRAKKVTVSFKNVPWDEALKAILEAYQLGMVKVGETIVRIDEVGKLAAYITELEKIKKIEIQREPTKVLVMRLNSSKAVDVAANITKILANDITLDTRIKISPDERTNAIVMEAPERILAKVKKYNKEARYRNSSSRNRF